MLAFSAVGALVTQLLHKSPRVATASVLSVHILTVPHRPPALLTLTDLLAKPRTVVPVAIEESWTNASMRQRQQPL